MQATSHLIVPDEQGAVKLQSGNYRLACDPAAVWVTGGATFTAYVDHVHCPVCKVIGEKLQAAMLKSAEEKTSDAAVKAAEALERDLARIAGGQP